MPNSPARRILGIAKEITPGTAVAPTDFQAFKTLTAQPKIVQLTDEAMRGSAAKTYGHQQGPTYAELDISANVFPDLIGFAVVGILGDDTVTGASAPFTHAATLLNSGNQQPPSYTITDYNSVNARAYAGAKFSSITLKWSADGLLEVDIKAMSLSYAPASTPVASYTALTPVASWPGAVQIAGASSSIVTDGELTIARTVEPINTVDGTQAPYAMWAAGDLTCTGKFTAVYEDDTLNADYLNSTPTALDFNWQLGAGATAIQLKAHLSTATLTNATVQSGKTYMELACDFEGDANTTDKGASGGFSPVAVTLKNAKAAGTYL
jgi:Phage tail tube protein